METRNISIDLDTAKRWYEGCDATLKELAIKAFPELEKVTYTDVMQKICLYGWVSNPISGMISTNTRKIEAFNKLNNIAAYFNKGWKKQPEEKAYFIVRDNGYRASYHISVVYPTIIYFKNKEDAVEAIRLMGDDLQYL